MQETEPLHSNGCLNSGISGRSLPNSKTVQAGASKKPGIATITSTWTFNTESSVVLSVQETPSTCCLCLLCSRTSTLTTWAKSSITKIRIWCSFTGQMGSGERPNMYMKFITWNRWYPHQSLPWRTWPCRETTVSLLSTICQHVTT